MPTAHDALAEAFVLHQGGKFEQAEQQYREMLAADPTQHGVWQLLGVLAHQTGRIDEAVEHLSQAIGLDANKPGYYYNLGCAQRDLGETSAAISSLHTALAHHPNHAGAHHNLGRIYQQQGQLDDAIVSFEASLAASPDSVETLSNLAATLQQRGRHVEAITRYRQALATTDQDAELRTDLATAQWQIGKLDDALASFDSALAAKPDLAIAAANRAMLLILSGNLPEGWDQYEWRRQLASGPLPWETLDLPLWQGEPLAGRRLLVHGEQGVGDEIMFATCLPDLLAAGADITVTCDPRLAPLFARSFTGLTVIGFDRQRDDAAALRKIPAELQTPIGSLPRFFRRRWESFPRTRQLLTCCPQRLQRWQARYTKLGAGLKVGISWRGGEGHQDHYRRSCPLRHWQPLLAQPGVHWINLQHGTCQEEIAAVQSESGITIHDWPDSDPTADLDDLAAKIAALDLVISVTNSNVQFGGALGVPTWVVLPPYYSWRWFLNHPQSPWYESLRVFRSQEVQPGSQWLHAVGAELARHIDRSSTIREASHHG